MTITQMFKNRLAAAILLTVATVVQFIVVIRWSLAPKIDGLGTTLLGFTMMLTAAAAGILYGLAMFMWRTDIVPRGLQKKALRLW